MECLFWISSGLIAYVYAGYPLLLAVAGARWSRRPVAADAPLPQVSLIVSAYNEAPVIHEKLANATSLDYPRDRLEILVVSDCSDDGTDSIVEAFPDERVRLLRLPTRSGKSLGLNLAVEKSAGDVLVFTDANAIFERQALNRLVGHFADNEVGVVTGEQRYYPSQGGEDHEGLYWRYELLLKRLETHAGSLVGGDGAIMAIRKRLYRSLQASDLSDYLLPLHIVSQGYRNIYEHEARCFEHPAGDLQKEFARKVRIVNRAWRATLTAREVLNPFRQGWFALQVWSHKVLRWTMAMPLAVAMVTSLALAAEHWLYAAAASAQGTLYTLALLGWLVPASRASTVVSIPYYFCLINLAGIKGIYDNHRGRTYTTWNTARESKAGRP